jgi:hypothetical protein
MDILITVVAVITIIYIAFLPTSIASNRKHPSVSAIFICNVVGLFTGVFWLVALVWSFTGANK